MLGNSDNANERVGLRDLSASVHGNRRQGMRNRVQSRQYPGKAEEAVLLRLSLAISQSETPPSTSIRAPVM